LRQNSEVKRLQNWDGGRTAFPILTRPDPETGKVDPQPRASTFLGPQFFLKPIIQVMVKYGSGL
jgi:hypothetical protein